MNLYPDLLGAAFDKLPSAVRAFHDPQGATIWKGSADVTRGRGIVASLACQVFGFPNSGNSVPLLLTVTPLSAGERWDRDFGGRVMSTVQYARDGLLIERLGLVLIKMRTIIEGNKFSVVPVGWSILGLPLPRFLMPTTQNFETEIDGVFHFDVAIAAPLVGPIVTYRGRLEVCDV